MEKKRKKRTSKPSELEVENRKIGRILYFFNSLTSRLEHVDADIYPLINKDEKKYLSAACCLIDSVVGTMLGRQRDKVNKLKEERNAS